MLQMLRSRKKPWDIIIIGGGATGLGTAIDAASRGYETLLIEKNDFAKGTSSRSTKLVHGGVRYLQNGDISLVVEALRERGLMKNNAPHLVQNLSFVIPSYEWWSSPFYGIGLKIYDMMAGKLGLGSTTFLNKEEVLQFIPTIKQEELNGGVIYYDGQFDDARMATSMAQTAVDHNAVVINYIEVKNLLKRKGMVAGVKLKDQFSDDEYEVFGRVVINATGVFSDSIMKMDNPEAPDTIAPSQGIHLVLDRKFLNSDHAIMVPQTSDGRVMFAVPWHNKVVIGTTDTLVSEILEEPRPREEEIDFLLKTAADYMTVPPKRSDIKSIFAGLRPLAAASNEKKETKEVSRGHKIVVSDSGLVSIVGGKWTTYRKMAEDTVNTAIGIAGLPERTCLTQNLPIHGYEINSDWTDPYYIYGRDKDQVRNMDSHSEISLSDQAFITRSQIRWAIRHEMAMTIEDVLARRNRILFLDAQEAINLAPVVAKIFQEEHGWSDTHANAQIQTFTTLANQYLNLAVQT